jgi:hypothetical protein
METADFDHNVFSPDRSQQHAADRSLAVRFFVKAKQDADASAKEGRPIFKEYEYIQIMMPGDRTQVNIRPLSARDKERFAAQYENWKKNNSNEVLNGTPLEAWGLLSLAQIEEYRFFGIRTIEHMADLRDDIAGKIPGATILKQKAKAFIEIAKQEAPMKRVQEELDKRDAEIAALKNALAEQGAALQQLQQGRKQK